MSDNKFNVKPILCEKDNWYRMGIFHGDEVLGYLLWIESSQHPNNFCKTNVLEMGKPICETIESAESMCNQIQALIDSGEII